MATAAQKTFSTASTETVAPRRDPSFDTLRGTVVCHLSPIESRRDERAFSRECVPALRYGLRPLIIASHCSEETVDGVKCVSLPKSRGRVQRILSTPRFIQAALRQRADIYHIHSPELIPVGLILKFVYGKKVIYDTREDFPSMMLTKTYLPTNLRRLTSRIVASVERLAARSVDGFITADSGTLRQQAKVGNSRKLVFYNFPNLDYFPEPAKVDKPFDLVYRGGLSERAGTFVLLNALRLLKEQGLPLRLLMFGYADSREIEDSIRHSIFALGIEGLVTLKGVIHHEEMAATLSQARIAICPLQRIPKFMNNIPVKVFESWACGLPVIATDLPPIRPFFGNRPYGMLVKPGDTVGLAKAIRRMTKSDEMIAEFGRQARQAVVDRYNTEPEIRKLLSLYKEVLLCHQRYLKPIHR